MSAFIRLISRVKSYKNLFIASIISNILLSVFTVASIPLLIPFFQMLFEKSVPVSSPPVTNDLDLWINYYLSTLIADVGKTKALMLVCGTMIVVFFLKNLFRYLALYFMAPVRNGIIYDIRKELFNKFLELPLSFYSGEKKGKLLSGMTTDVQEIEWSILNVLEAIFKAPIIMVGSIFFMIYISPQLTLFVLFLLLFTAVIIGGISKNLKKQSSIVQEKVGELTSTLEETIGGIRIIKGFGAENYQAKKFGAENIGFKDILTRLLWRRDMSAPLSEFLGITVVTVLLYYGSILVFDDLLQPETFFTFVFAFYQVIEPSKSFASAYYNIQKGMGALERIENILNTPNPIQEKENAEVVNDFSESIIFDNVSFVYKDSSEKVLDEVNLTIPKGSVLAIVGPSGAGKSTLADMLPRFYDPVSGSIRIDGKDIRNVTLSSLRDVFGMVSQEAILFHDTIRNNITFGKDASEEAIMAASKVANAHDFISAMPDGYDTVIGDRGMKLSGGQRQRLTIARAILRNPPVLILDEATSALDSESEKLVQEALTKLMEGRTSVVIAHRLSTIQNADIIVVMEKGKIIQQGSHAELIKDDNMYKKLVNLQNML
ncbi:MAG: ABC transporter ATP-binding protein [Saprospiraceae bacterium]|nr:ABC transporter ATP-binding protein [Saprospiraceae bacterium]MBK6564074.1 ABC transporter ATP-binding protein [Saprospiraceae bacterium]MBK7525340.1 ABC transporter ATP-binding protein [Saprospiraceae bacterium]MBK8372289.1 ABC transporter ATP-binding protein [Saprospiraceae bacterium]MBK8819971.1 ABC transporter ATP-binding protein [Saprospiraceae bacterium]